MSEAGSELALTLYTTAGCHLCEQAEAVLRNGLCGISLQLVDIAESEELVASYGLRIPVLRIDGTDLELGWPFDALKAADFLEQNID
jgi:glutaredoxin